MSKGEAGVPMPRLECQKPGCGQKWIGAVGQIPPGCPRCGGVMMTWVNSAEVVQHLMRHDPEYRRSYTQGG